MGVTINAIMLTRMARSYDVDNNDNKDEWLDRLDDDLGVSINAFMLMRMARSYMMVIIMIIMMNGSIL